MPALLPDIIANWFAGRGWTPRDHQLALLEKARDRRHALLIAPTGAGKTLAGFLPSLCELIETTRPKDAGVHTLYLSPLKALAADVARNLVMPVSEMGLKLAIETRTGDTSAAQRLRQRDHPPDILLTTPEQLALFVGTPNAARMFEGLSRIIIDEAHALAPGKRGDLLSLALSVLQTWQPNVQRVGLSATVAKPEEIARWLVPQGMDEEHMADIVLGPAGAGARVDVLLGDGQVPWAGHTGRFAIADVYRQIAQARTALVFVNTRFQAELTFQELWKINEDGLPIALHHGSLDVAQRRKVEAAMAAGALRAVVCTSTLDLGIDWGSVDLVIQMGAPKGAARLVQRIGRSNHTLDAPSHAVLVPTNRFEMLECAVAKSAVAAGAMDAPPPRHGGLDILAQHVLGRAVGTPIHPEALFAEVRSAAPYAALERTVFDEVVGFVRDGGYALASYERFQRLVPADDAGRLKPRNPDVVRSWRMNVGANVEAPLLKVRQTSPGAARAGAKAQRPVGGRLIGEVEEYFIAQLSPGDTFLFAGEVWRFEGVSQTDALVSRAPANAEPKVPTWGGGKFPLSTFLAAGVRAMIADEDGWPALHPQVHEWLAIQKLKSMIPQPGDLLVETFPRGNRHYLVAYPFEGRLAHNTLAMLLTRRLERAGAAPLGFAMNDYAVSIWAGQDMGDLDMEALFDQDMLGDDLDAWLAESVLMKRTFRNCAVIAGLIEQRSTRGERSGRQVAFSTDLIYDVLRAHQPDHVLMRAAWADAGEGLLDIHRLGDLLARVKDHIRHMALDRISPFAVPLMLEIGKVPVRTADGVEAILEEAAAASLISEAMGSGD
jgi:ATP-dependent helicase Lhr and Lhr-like helicase